MSLKNNFKDIPNTPYLWVEVGDWIFKVEYKNDKWYESITNKKDIIIEICIDTQEDMESIYLSHAIDCYKMFCRQSKDFELDFADRLIDFSSGGYFGDSISVQIGKEDSDGTHSIDPCPIKKNDWLILAQFFELTSHLFLNFDNLLKDIGKE